MPDIRAIHIDHGLHPDSATWADACRASCHQFGVPLTVERIRVDRSTGGGPEASARMARYAAFARLLAPGDILLTAHHRDDQAETLLLQLFRGTGLRGVASMPGLTAFAGGHLARPLLGYSRAQLEVYARENRLHWIEDPSNSRLDLRRNFVRQRLLPLAREVWPQAAAALARSADSAAQASGLVDEVANLDLASCRLPGAFQALSVPALRSLPPGRLESALRLWLRSAGRGPPDHRHLTMLVRQIRSAPHTGSATLSCPGAELRRHRDSLYLTDIDRAPPPILDVPWDPDRPIDLPALGLNLSAQPSLGEGLSRARLAGRRIRLRLRQGGERCRLPGRRHHHQLKKILQAYGVAPWLRPRLPLIYVDGNLAGVADLWAFEPYAAVSGEAGWRVILREI